MNPIQPPPDSTQKASNLPYIGAVIVMALLAIVAVLVITMLRPEADNTMLIATILGFAGTTTASILALMKSQETHLTVNSQLALWKKDFSQVMQDQGKREGIKEEQDRTAVLRKKESEVAQAAALAATATGITRPAPTQWPVGGPPEPPTLVDVVLANKLPVGPPK